MNILDILLIKNTEIDRSMFRSLYFSYDDISFVGFNKDLIKCLQKYNEYEIIKERITEIGEYHKELKYIVKTSDNKYFFRILKDESDLIYDILIYSVKDIDKIIRVFFPEIINIPENIKKLKNPIIIVSNHVYIVNNHNELVKYLGYEDWDYKNKCLNQLDLSALDKDFINYFKKADFTNTFEFEKNGGAIVSLTISFKYLDGYYIVDKIK